MGVTGVHVPPVEFLLAQVEAVLDDLAVAAVKTGMLATEEVVRAVAGLAAAGRLPRLVVDPVLVSSTGARLLDPGAERAYTEALFPHALVVTPNTREASALLGRPVVTVADARDAARDLAAFGPRWVVVKGGHLADDAGDAVDVVFDAGGGAVTELRAPRVATRNDHGPGAASPPPPPPGWPPGPRCLDALASAKRFVHAGLVSSAGWRLGGGHGPVGKLGAWGPPRAGETTPE